MASVQIVAEIGTNWEPGNLESALEMIRVAKACGADAVKFQNLDIDRMDRPDWWKEKTRPWGMPQEWWLNISKEAYKNDIAWFFSIFEYRALQDAKRFYKRIIKLAASEIGNRRLMRWISKEHRDGQVYLSVDYRKLGAVVPALTWLPDCAVTLLYCASDYPAITPYQGGFDELRSYGLPVGWSSHLPILTAVDQARYYAENGATVIEAHLRTEETPAECPDNGPWALYPEEFAELVKAVRDVS